MTIFLCFILASFGVVMVFSGLHMILWAVWEILRQLFTRQ